MLLILSSTMDSPTEAQLAALIEADMKQLRERSKGSSAFGHLEVSDAAYTATAKWVDSEVKKDLVVIRRRRSCIWREASSEKQTQRTLPAEHSEEFWAR